MSDLRMPQGRPTVSANSRSIQQHGSVYKTKAIFCNVAVLCGTAIVLAITIKVILSLFP